jgi:YidC/Oxa1 family membrane protein insertase
VTIGDIFMDKDTIIRYVIAIALCIVLVIGFMVIPNLIGGKPAQTTSTEVQSQTQTQSNQKSTTETKKTNTIAEAESVLTPVEESNLVAEDKHASTKEFDITFSTKGGVVKSIKLKNYKEKDEKGNDVPIEIVVSRDTGIYPFGIKFGDHDSANDLFEFRKNESENSFEFKRDYKFLGEDNKEYSVVLKKKFVFGEDYLFEFVVSLESPESKYIPLNFNDNMYVLNFGPQIGPGFTDKLISNELRTYTFFDTERRDITGDVANKKKTIEKLVRWIAIESKYFIVIANPPTDFIDKRVGFDETRIDGISKHSSMFFDRKYERVASIEDRFRFYIGPKKKEMLEKYANYDFDKALAHDFLFGWLVDILKFALNGFNSIVHNWGISIIILTILIKVIFFPITQKGMKSSMKMQSLAPKMEEIKAKYKDNPQKQQAETATLYKKEGINPLTGCLPLLIQIPFFYALYQLLNTQFDLRGAMFIPGWINDLSSPEFIFTLPFSIPVLTDKIRLLPFLVLGTQFFQQKLTPTNTGGSAKQMKLLMYAMPLVFFFIMYPLPSGLNLYWTVQNLLSIINQLYNNIALKNKIVTSVTTKTK